MGWVFLIIGSFAIFMNWRYAIAAAVSGRSYSTVPLIGGLLASIGVYQFGIDSSNFLFWIPFIVDLGCIPMLVAFVVGFIKEKMRS